ncbi:MAG: hypothetical protein ACRD8W_01650 [Nitrososphaeraceae archaeon]
MTEQSFNHRYPSVGLYRRKNRRRPYRKLWVRKKAKDKKGFTRYSTGPKWASQSNPYRPTFWRSYQDRKWHNYGPDELLSSGYTRNQTWIALCKSWNGFLLAKRECDPVNMMQYIGQIRKLQKDLGLEQTEFDGYTPTELAEIDLEFDEDFLTDWYGATV